MMRAVFSCVQTMVWLPVFGMFNVRSYADACSCTRGLYGHRKSICTEADFERNIPCHTSDSKHTHVAFQSDSLPTGLFPKHIVFLQFLEAAVPGCDLAGGNRALHRGRSWEHGQQRDNYNRTSAGVKPETELRNN